MSSSITPNLASPCFQLKGSMITMMTLELYHFTEPVMRQQLQELTAQAPHFFDNTPIVVALEQLTPPSPDLDMATLKRLCTEFGIHLIAIRGGSEQMKHDARALGLSTMPAIQSGQRANQNASNVSTLHQKLKVAAGTAAKADIIALPTRIITTPVRSGQQIFHQGDLVITAPVSAGAEIIAEGHIHAYAVFRGRALAGVKGNQEAKIFFVNFDAELISINGHYKTSADIDISLRGRSLQAGFCNDNLLLQTF